MYLAELLPSLKRIASAIQDETGADDDAVVAGMAKMRMLGVQSVFYDAEHAALFDVLPARSGERTVRPALVRDGELVRRGVAAVAPMAAKEA